MDFRIMSFNIWGDYFNNPVTLRENDIGRVIGRYSPDIIAIQEATENWNSSELFRSLRGELSESAQPGESDVGGYNFTETPEAPSNNYVPLLYKRNKFLCAESGFVSFPDTPDESKGATWAVLSDFGGTPIVAAICTHFWWKFPGIPEMDALRVSNAVRITEKAHELNKKYNIPVVALGDLNSTAGTPALVYLRDAKWHFARDEAPITSDVCTEHGDPELVGGRYRGKVIDAGPEDSLDHILYIGEIEPKRFDAVTDQEALDASDHTPVICDFALPDAPSGTV